MGRAGVGQRLPVAAYTVIGGQRIALEVATTPSQRAIGLMHRRQLAANRGMLFPFSPAQRVSFWMRDVAIPLDMIFVRQGRVVQIERATPCVASPCVSYVSATPVDGVIELAGGRAEALGLGRGDRIRVTPQPG